MNQTEHLTEVSITPILNEVIRRASVPMLVLDSHETMILINQAASDILGYPIEECLGQDYMERVMHTQHPSFVNRATKKGALTAVFHRDGSFFALRQIAEYPTQDGDVMCLCSMVDVTETSQTQALLERIAFFTLQQEYEAVYLFDSEKNEYRTVSCKGITQKERLPRGTLTQWQLASAIELPKEEQDEVFPPFHLETAKQALQLHHSYQFLFRRRNAEGEIRRTLASYRSYDDQRLILCLKDVEDEERQKDALIQRHAERLANRSKSAFLSRMSHDICTPLNTIIGSVEIAKTVPKTPVGVTDALCHMESASQFLLSLIQDILDVNKIENGKLRLLSEAFDLNELLQNVALLVFGNAGRQDVTFHCTISPVLLRYYIGDKLRLKQILMNLLSNAMKYAKRPGGKVWLRVKPYRQDNLLHGLSFEIEDNGIGISEDFLKHHIWEPFEREHEDIQGMSGSGLGLTIVKNITELMHGSISVQSTLGQGSTFVVALPLFPAEDQSEHHEAEAEKSEPDKDFEGQRILLAEDHDVNAKIMKMLLEHKHLLVERVCNGKEAVERFLQSAPQYYAAILMDIRMPVMDGIQAAKAIRHADHRQAESIPIFALSANAFAEDIEKSKQAGMQVHLSKPIKTDVLFAELQKYL